MKWIQNCGFMNSRWNNTYTLGPLFATWHISSRYNNFIYKMLQKGQLTSHSISEYGIGDVMTYRTTVELRYCQPSPNRLNYKLTSACMRTWKTIWRPVRTDLLKVRICSSIFQRVIHLQGRFIAGRFIAESIQRKVDSSQDQFVTGSIHRGSIHHKVDSSRGDSSEGWFIAGSIYAGWIDRKVYSSQGRFSAELCQLKTWLQNWVRFVGKNFRRH
jgi:hypothetical protein